MTSPSSDPNPVPTKMPVPPRRPENLSPTARYTLGASIIGFTVVGCVGVGVIIVAEQTTKPVVNAVVGTLFAALFFTLALVTYLGATSTQDQDEYVTALEAYCKDQWDHLWAKYAALNEETLEFRVALKAARIMGRDKVVEDVVAREMGPDATGTGPTGTAEPGKI